MPEVRRDLWKSSGPIPLLKQGHLERVAQDHVKTSSEYLQGWRLPKLPGKPIPVLGHSHSKDVFPDVQMAPPVFQFVPVASGPVTRHHWKEPGPVVFAPSLQLFLDIGEIPPEPSLLQVKQSQISQSFLIGMMFSFLHHLCDILLDSFQQIHVSLVLGSPELDRALQAWPYQHWIKGKDHLPC